MVFSWIITQKFLIKIEVQIRIRSVKNQLCPSAIQKNFINFQAFVDQHDICFPFFMEHAQVKYTHLGVSNPRADWPCPGVSSLAKS